MGYKSVKFAAFGAVAVLMLALQGCNNSNGDDARYMDKAPPTAPGARGLPPATGKVLPGMGGPSTMGGSPPAGAGMGSKPATAPKTGS